ncbi:MAG: citrate synthase [Akkermansiaceae bacterium]|nr:citrate synthase [Akkermansiaceae bacterium]MCP5542922.1 citrate synthase [Akkermansiaceae bacterium]
MKRTAELTFDGKTLELPTVVGSEGEVGIDIATLRSGTGCITLDPGYGNTGSCESAITFIDGEKGILRYRGYDIAELAERSTFIETAYLLIYGDLPTRPQLAEFSEMLTENQMLHESMRHHFEGFPASAHPMAILSAMINAASSYHPNLIHKREERFPFHAARLISQVRTIAAFSHRKAHGLPVTYPKSTLKYTANFLHMMFSMPGEDADLKPEVVRALDTIFLLHADHEQNCSTSTVRMVASSRANLFASASAGVCALWGPLHGGANQAVLEMLQQIHDEGDDGSKFLAAVKDKTTDRRLMGFGHRVYKNFDPRALIIKEQCDKVLAQLHQSDPLLDIAKKLEEIALHDDYFISRKLYPNVDFYSGIIMRAIGIPLDMFTVMFAIGRMPGWIANFKEVMEDPTSRISRPRQIYTGPTQRNYVPVEERA